MGTAAVHFPRLGWCHRVANWWPIATSRVWTKPQQQLHITIFCHPLEVATKGRILRLPSIHIGARPSSPLHERGHGQQREPSSTQRKRRAAEHTGYSPLPRSVSSFTRRQRAARTRPSASGNLRPPHFPHSGPQTLRASLVFHGWHEDADGPRNYLAHVCPSGSRDDESTTVGPCIAEVRDGSSSS